MLRTIRIALFVLILIGLGLLATTHWWVPSVVNAILSHEQSPSESASVGPEEEHQNAFDGRNATFTIDGTPVTLVNGVSKVPAAPGSASNVTTRYFGNEATGDLTGDDLSDTAFLVTQEAGGSGTFYYAVVAVAHADGSFTTTNAFLVGDRIAPQSTYIPKNSMELQVNYAERKPGEPMTAQPSQGATLLLKVTPQGVLEGLMK